MSRTRALACAAIFLVTGCKKDVEKHELPPELQQIESGFEEIRRTTSLFVLAISADAYEDAYGKLCKGVRAGLSLQAFTAAVRANPYLHGATKAGEMPNGRFSIESSTMTSVEPMAIESTAGTVRADAYLSKTDGAWCITGMVVGGTPVLPAPGK
jgi:hypothetical protein